MTDGTGTEGQVRHVTTHIVGAAQPASAVGIVNGPVKTDPVEAIRELTEGFGADVVIEAVGRP